MPLPHDPFSPQDPYAVDAKGTTTPAPETPAEVVVPKGTSAELISWVGTDKTKAQLALDSESATEKPRKGLVDELKEILEK